MNNQNPEKIISAQSNNAEQVPTTAQPPEIPQNRIPAPSVEEANQNPANNFIQSHTTVPSMAKNDSEKKEKKDRLKFRLEMMAALLAIVGSLIAIFVYFLPDNSSSNEPKSREEVAGIILKALREGDKDTFEQHLSVEILNSSGDGENLDALFIAWQKDANKPGMTAEKLARVATFVRENEKWKLNEK